MRTSLSLYIDLLGTYLWPQRRQMVALGLLLTASIGLQLAAPQFLRTFIDTALEQGAVGVLYFAAGMFLVFGLATHGAALLAKYVGTNVGWRATNRLRSDLALHLLRLDMPFHNEHTPGELIERVDTDITRLANFFSFFTIRLVGGLMLTFGVLAVLFVEDARIGLMVTAFVVVFLTVHTVGQRLTLPFRRAEREASADFSGYLAEAFPAIGDIQTSGAGEHVIRRFHSLVRPVFRAQVKSEVIGSTSWALTDMVGALGFAATLALGAYLFQNGTITIGTVYLVIHYLNTIRYPLVQISREVQDLQRAPGKRPARKGAAGPGVGPPRWRRRLTTPWRNGDRAGERHVLVPSRPSGPQRRLLPRRTGPCPGAAGQDRQREDNHLSVDLSPLRSRDGIDQARRGRRSRAGNLSPSIAGRHGHPGRTAIPGLSAREPTAVRSKHR